MADPNRMQEDWQSPNFRSKIVNKLEDVMRNSQTQMPKSSVEMEEYVFRKARTREEYLDLVARVLLSVGDHNSKDKKMNSGIPPNMGQPGMNVMRAQVTDQDPMNALQSLTVQGAGAMGRPADGFTAQYDTLGDQMTNQMTNQYESLGGMMHGMGGNIQQPRMMQNIRAQMGQRPQNLIRQDAFIVTSSQAMQGQAHAMSVSSPGMTYSAGPIRQMQGQGQYLQGRDIGISGMPVQSPAQGSPLTMMSSPHMMPSPVVRGQMGVPSPNTMLHTPGTAVSDPSPGPPSTSQEEMEYVKKLEKLSRYIEPLRKFVIDSEKKTDEDSKKNHKKMKSLLDILTNPKKRVPMVVLEKCEQVLQKLTTSSSVSSAHGHMCQPLLDAVAHFSTASYLNHSLHRTFGPALEAYMGPAIKAPSPPLTKKRVREDEIPDILQGEIARLERRFCVSLDSRYHPGSECHHLVCKLDEHQLPSVPPLLVTIPRTYPKSSPRCDPSSCPGYDATEFFQNVEKNLAVHLSNMPNRFCLTQLLSSWEMSVRKACDPVNPLIAQVNPTFV
ncbi:mediator of RNA polymerase II transcription subunit 15-like isoform X2 [Physella acuta]|uniref:mediator of RNA polymerase II transcription subunit 15-like isoform X2 n=1 Tax=Physella acuta TaxID=109671 RepID=UPI0027DD87D2|nr:mediator of RNA polymerase II transcription subunit 15-like isoform X2 [Physella acuta]